MTESRNVVGKFRASIPGTGNARGSGRRCDAQIIITRSTWSHTLSGLTGEKRRVELVGHRKPSANDLSTRLD